MKTKIVSVLCLSLFLVACNKTNTSTQIPTNNVVQTSQKTTTPNTQPNTETSESKTGKTVDVPKIKPSELANSIQTFALKDNESFKSCVQYAVENCQQTAISEKAITDKSDDSCELLKNEQAKKSCKTNLWQQLAQQEQDMLLCEKITDKPEAQSCKNLLYLQKAIAEKDASICKKIINYEKKETEKDNKGGIENYEKIRCLEQVKFIKENESLLIESNKKK